MYVKLRLNATVLLSFRFIASGGIRTSNLTPQTNFWVHYEYHCATRTCTIKNMFNYKSHSVNFASIFWMAIVFEINGRFYNFNDQKFSNLIQIPIKVENLLSGLFTSFPGNLIISSTFFRQRRGSRQKLRSSATVHFYFHKD